MTTRDVAVMDAFATAPGEGLPVGLVPDGGDLADDQRAAIARDLAPAVTAIVEEGPDAGGADGTERDGGDDAERDGGDGTERDGAADAEPISLALAGNRRDLEAAVRATIGALARYGEEGAVAAGEFTVDVTGVKRAATVHEDGTVTVDVPAPSVEESLVDAEDAATALGVDPAALRDVGADLPIATVDLGERLLVVPVNYFEHVSGASPDASALADLRDRTGADRVIAYTFDALDRDNLAHAVAATPADGRGGVDGRATEGPGGSVGVTGAAAVATVARRFGAVEGDDPLAVETGHFVDRPAVVTVETDGHDVAVRGGARPSLTGEMAVPAAEANEIIEV